MQKSKNDVWVGMFVLIGVAAMLFLALKSANLLQMNFSPTYQITARFDNIGGLKPSAAVKSAGVVVGRVSSVSFDTQRFQAAVVLDMNTQFAFPIDSSLKILTSGLLGMARASHIRARGLLGVLDRRMDSWQSSVSRHALPSRTAVLPAVRLPRNAGVRRIRAALSARIARMHKSRSKRSQIARWRLKPRAADRCWRSCWAGSSPKQAPTPPT